METYNELVELPLLQERNIILAVKREDLIHPWVSGNKFRKLKFNLLEAKALGHDVLLTFGGAFSNHIMATAAAGKEHGFRTIGVVRGDELLHKWRENPTLKRAHDMGMVFEFVSRKAYANKDEMGFRRLLEEKFGRFYLLPEGGTNALAIQGCEEIVTPKDSGFDIIATCVGTGGTMAGLVRSSAPGQTVIGFPALKGHFLEATLKALVTKENWELVHDYHFGGYAKITGELVHFINGFKTETGIQLDPVYTGKMMYGLLHMIGRGDFASGTRILAIHTGGLQGIAGMNAKLRKKKLPLLQI